jgi:uncharacterized protein (UPF0332 family)
MGAARCGTVYVGIHWKMDWEAFIHKAESNLRVAVALDAGECDPSVSRAYFAVFHVEIAALLRLTDFRPESWGHDRVQAEFNRRLVNERKLFSGGLRFVHSDLIGRRHIADYDERHIGRLVAERCVRKARQMLDEVAPVLRGGSQ